MNATISPAGVPAIPNFDLFVSNHDFNHQLLANDGNGYFRQVFDKTITGKWKITLTPFDNNSTDSWKIQETIYLPQSDFIDIIPDPTKAQ